MTGLKTYVSSSLIALGEVGLLTRDTARQAFRRPFERAALIEQIESIGVRSMSVVVGPATPSV